MDQGEAMAGHARRDAIMLELSRRMLETFGADDDNEVQPTTLDYVCNWLENGKTLKSLASELDAKLHAEVSPAMLQRVLERKHGEDIVVQGFDAARTRASHQYAEDALAIVDAPADTQVEVSRAASRARSRQWLAEKYNARQFGSSKDVQVAINIGSLHLAALQAGKPLSQVLLPSIHASSIALVDDAQVIDTQ
jgi:hypothetical protein